MQCGYFDRHECRSCTFMNVPYPQQLDDGARSVAATLHDHVSPEAWMPPAHGAEQGFRNNAKLVVGGRRGAPTLGILDGSGNGVDLTGCGLYEPGLSRALPGLREVIAQTELTTYDVPSRNGELKNVLVTHSPDGELMIRFVLRSTGQLSKVQRAVPVLQQRIPGVRVVSVNLLPDHRAVMEGDEEIILTEHQTLPMRVNDLTLHLRPASFFQTNTGVAGQLYAQARDWTRELAPRAVVDLFCGVGGFGLHAAGPTVEQVFGVERSSEAVESARRSATELRAEGCTTQFEFVAADAFPQLDQAPEPDLMIVNPPRRGIGADQCERLDAIALDHLIYSSCNPRTLADDLRRMPGFGVDRARLFHMFPQTPHHEVLVLLSRQ
ncbi:methyltransferase domain-containing protein [Yimella sp. cx-51]|uniref:methyltransferase domain-containing protein n=1 Tax=Yimella sp. cx-51 TaxID=2770551 RepID=UPI00165E6212|nr:methyltransferase domain-containing protein [Yimella sp. cx-51]MBC9957798.1 methyltransferase domain-containing protein [Yimella sp. cx-51]QTH36860.1 methyltransferase domain-containing protein [Yimella sp. cx-51]